jgi:hypothetical protein
MSVRVVVFRGRPEIDADLARLISREPSQTARRTSGTSYLSASIASECSVGSEIRGLSIHRLRPEIARPGPISSTPAASGIAGIAYVTPAPVGRSPRCSRYTSARCRARRATPGIARAVAREPGRQSIPGSSAAPDHASGPSPTAGAYFTNGPPWRDPPPCRRLASPPGPVGPVNPLVRCEVRRVEIAIRHPGESHRKASLSRVQSARPCSTDAVADRFVPASPVDSCGCSVDPASTRDCGLRLGVGLAVRLFPRMHRLECYRNLYRFRRSGGGDSWNSPKCLMRVARSRSTEDSSPKYRASRPRSTVPAFPIARCPFPKCRSYPRAFPKCRLDLSHSQGFRGFPLGAAPVCRRIPRTSGTGGPVDQWASRTKRSANPRKAFS